MKKIISLFLSVVMIASLIFSAGSLSAETPEKYMLHLNNVVNKQDAFMIDVDLEPNVEYTAEFNYNFISGELHNGNSGQIFFDLYNTNGSVGMKRGAVLRRSTEMLGTAKGFTKRVSDGNKISYTFTLTESEDENAGGNYRAGFYLYQSSINVECYIGNFTIYATNDSSKTNLLDHKFDRNDMLGCYTDWCAGTQSVTVFNSTLGSVNLTAQFETFDDDMFDKILETSDKYMMHATITKVSEAESLVQGVSLSADVEYTAEFNYEFVTGSMHNGDVGTAYFVVATDRSQYGSRRGSSLRQSTYGVNSNEPKAFTSITNSGNKLKYTFTLTSQEVVDNNGAFKIGIVFIANNATNLYFADFTLYETNDSLKTNLLPHKGNTKNLYGIHTDWYTAKNPETLFDSNDKNVRLTAQFEAYDETKFPSNEEDVFEKQMLHIAGIEGKDNDSFMIDAALQPNVEYTVEFNYNFVTGKLHNGNGGQMYFDLYNTTSPYGMKRGSMLRRSTIAAGATNGFTTKTDVNGKMTYTFTLTGTEHETARGKYRIGFYVVDSAVECYISDLRLYATTDSDKTNLISHKFNRNDLKGCYSDWHTGTNTETEFNGSTSAKYTAKFEIYDATKLQPEDVVKKMLHIAGVDGQDNDAFMIDAVLQPNVEYTVEFNYYFVNGGMHNGNGGQMFFDLYNTTSPYGMKRGSTLRRSTVELGTTQGFTTRTDFNGKLTYTFTLTSAEHETAGGKYRVGFYVIKGTVECYIANLKVYATADTEKTNLLSHKFDRNDMSGCYSDWHTGTDSETVFDSVTKAKYTAQFEAYDATKFLPEDTGDCIPYGDANQDGAINVLDIIRVKTMIANQDYSATADVNKDGILDSEDIISLKKHILGEAIIVTIVYPQKSQTGGANIEAIALKNQISNLADTVKPVTSVTYYVDPVNGNDNNNGKSEDKAIKTISKLNTMPLLSGSVVLFKRGCTFRTTEALKLHSGVKYGTYGIGAKPIVSGSAKNYATANWMNVGGNIWKISNVPGEAGVVTFDSDTAIGVRKYSTNSLRINGDYFHDYKNSHDLYLYSTVNPSQGFKDIEIGTLNYGMTSIWLNNNKYAKSNITISNIGIKYIGIHGINLSYCTDVTITGCELEYIGGADARENVRYGNAIQVWNRGSYIIVEKCYFNQIFDAAFTVQGTSDAGVSFSEIRCDNSLIEYSSMNFEFWGSDTDSAKNKISNISFSNNIVRFAGYGFGGQQRLQKGDQAVLLSWNWKCGTNDTFSDFVISNNVFDVADCNIYYASNTLPIIFFDNKYYQKTTNFAINRASGIKATDQTTLEQEIATFDNNAAKVKWIS